MQTLFNTHNAKAENADGYVEVTQRRRLNDYVGSPVWSDEQIVEIIEGGWSC